MKPVVEWYKKGTIWEVQYIDGIMVTPDDRKERSIWLNKFIKYGNQKKPKFWFNRNPRLKGEYFVKDMIIMSTYLHLMVSENKDFSDWFLVKKPHMMTLIREAR